MAKSEFVCLKDYEDVALDLLDARYRDYFADGADDKYTLADNQAEFQKQFNITLYFFTFLFVIVA